MFIFILHIEQWFVCNKCFLQKLNWNENCTELQQHRAPFQMTKKDKEFPDTWTCSQELIDLLHGRKLIDSLSFSFSKVKCGYYSCFPGCFCFLLWTAKLEASFFLPGKFNAVYPLHFKGHDHGVSTTLHSGSETRTLAGNQRWQTRLAYAVQLEGWKLECYAFAWVFVLILLSRQVLPPLASFAKLCKLWRTGNRKKCCLSHSQGKVSSDYCSWYMNQFEKENRSSHSTLG